MATPSSLLIRSTGAFAALGLIAQTVLAGAPVLVNPLFTEGQAIRVDENVPVGKTLVLPLLASDPEGDVLGFTVQSSNPNIMARVRTGCPILKIQISYAGDPNATDGGGNPMPSQPFSGVMEFQLFRDLTPVTSGVIGGAAQAGFYNNQIFHRVIPNFIIQGGDPTGTGSGNPGFSFEHEFRSELIFSGRGQLAMANSNGGYDRGENFGSGFIRLGTFQATNSSQFFVTTEQPRFLDFKHTIFGQLIRGFALLDKVERVPRNASDKPTVPVKMDVVSLEPGRSDATLLISADDAGSAKLTVTATDPEGQRSTTSFVIQAKKDTFNDPPIPKPIPNLISPVGVAPSLPIQAFDLEHDYLLYGLASASGNTTPGTLGFAQIARNYNPRTTPGRQDFAVGVAGFNDPLVNVASSTANPFAPFDAYRFQVAEIGYGERPISATAVTVEGTAASALTEVVLAEFQDGDPGAAVADFSATVNWGDGTAQEESVGTTPKIKLERSVTRPGTFVVKGTHTYAQPGVYLVEVVIDGALGAADKIHGQAVITAPGATLRAVGMDFEHAGAVLRDRVVATFEDTAAGVGPGDFTARIDWGDGRASAGQIAANGPGRFVVRGTHTYLDAETFGIYVHLKRETPTEATAVAWSRVNLSGFKGPKHLPPFAAAHLVGEIVSADGQTFKSTTGKGGDSETRFAISIFIVNSGNRPSKAGVVRFYLSKDTRFNAADIPLKIGTFSEGNLPAIQPNGQIRYDLISSTVNGQTTDFRLVAPKGNTGSGFYILAHLDYSDPLIDQMPVSKDIAFGRVNGIIVKPRALSVTEAAGPNRTATFKVVLDRRPSEDVKLPLTLAPTTEVSMDKAELVFTPANWNQPQIVTVTATDDTVDDGSKVSNVTIGPADSEDEAWDGMSGGTVQVLASDDDPTPP